ncbi:MAG TPA: glycosyltransferase family A protein [Xanthobacteraceae bacterium]|nr:glycosyltransferase family A protein [Xanthobacteraceae bacterium]
MVAANGDETISVILPNFNHGRFLERSVSALLAQDLPPHEILIIDDASTDDSVPIIEQLAKTSPLIRLVRNATNVGVVAAQRHGLETISGRYIYLAAADDWILPGFFSYAVGMLRRYPRAGLFCSDIVAIDGVSGRTLGIRPPVMPRFRAGPVEPSEFRLLLARGDNWIVTAASVMRKDAILDAGGLDEELGSFADGFLVRKIALKHGFCYAPRVTMAWRVFPGGTSRQTALSLDRARRMMDLSSRKISVESIFPEDYAARFGERWRFAIARLALQSDPVDMSLIAALALPAAFDRRIVHAVWTIANGKSGRIALLAWLWFRLRPYRLTDLVASFLLRRLWYRYSISVSPNE